MADRLGELQTLVAIADTGSLVGAGRRLGRSAPSVSRDLAELERRVGAVLLERSTRKCSLTPAGIRLCDNARQVGPAYEDALSDAAGERTRPSGLIRLTAPITFGRDHVAPLASTFLDAHPAISIELDFVDRIIDLADERVDLAIRIGPITDEALVARQVGSLRRVLVASPRYLELNGAPAHPDELALHEMVLHTTRTARPVLSFRDEEGRPFGREMAARLTVNQPDTAIAAAREGRGIVNGLFHQLDDDLRSGRLLPVLEAFEPEPVPVSLVWLTSRRAWHRIGLIIDHLTEGLSSLRVLRAQSARTG